ncbi:E3 ubiquitin-protein ligase MARCHF3-like [Glandiceps talaboti]
MEYPTAITMVPVAKFTSSGVITSSSEDSQPSMKACLSLTSFSTVLSDGPICRICHEGDKYGEELISPCHCTGTMRYLHRGCIEHWLATANTTTCELCHYEFRTRKKSQPITQWLQRPSQPRDRRNFLGDIACLLILTILVSVSAWLCLNGAEHYLRHNGHQWEAAGLVGLTVILLLIFLFWAILSFRYHLHIWKLWRNENQLVQLVDSQIYNDQDEAVELIESQVTNYQDEAEQHQSSRDNHIVEEMHVYAMETQV